MEREIARSIETSTLDLKVDDVLRSFVHSKL